MNRHQRRANAKLGNPPVDRSAASMLAQGLDYHKAGKLAEAEECYRRILAIQPSHPDALQLVGSIAYQVGRYEVAAEWIRKAIRLDGTNPAWFSNLGLALERSGRFEESLASHNKALELKPDYAEAFNNRGNALKALGRIDEALASYDQALALNANYADALNNRGNILQMFNRLDEAVASYDRAQGLKPDYADASNNRGNALKQLGRIEEALRSYDTAVALSPNSATAFNNRGMALKDIGRCEEALANFDAALALNLDFVEAHNNRGVALAEVRRYDEAMSCYDTALTLSPHLTAVLNNRGNLLQELGRIEQALADYDKALALDPDYADAANGRGSILQKLDRTPEAEITLRRAIEVKPDYSEAYCNLGTVLIDLGKLFEAEIAIRRAVELKPNSIPALCNLGKLLGDLGRSDEAEAMIRHAVALQPDHPEGHFHLGTVLIKSGRLDEAETATRHAIALDPDLAGAHHNLGVALMELGRLTEAREAAERAVALAPREPLHFRQLGEVRKYVAGDSCLMALEALSNDEAALGTGKQIDLHFALAKAYADIGRTEDEFRRLLAGNRLKRARIDYDETSVLDEIDRVQQVFSSEFMRSAPVAGEPSAKPIFILGMPRSGTTLVEQILASHPEVFGAGELNLFERSVGDVRSAIQEAPAYPEITSHMADEHFRELGGRYLAGIRRLAPAASRITDKMPANFLFAGLIHLALPNATIIHTVRNPVDTCISCFSKLFTEGNFHSYDLAELGRYYRRYQALMTHWHRVLPPGRILDVHYEDTVADVEAVARRIVAHCGLSWDQRCLDFHRTERAVRTSSATQVRKPIYASSIGRRYVYGPLLEPLLAALSPPDPSFATDGARELRSPSSANR
jgi:tetratricopeptide (TPR) repeat protein